MSHAWWATCQPSSRSLTTESGARTSWSSRTSGVRDAIQASIPRR
ncbi:Uncharacterised protein [Mycobacteroides abscessus]|nr:Uncharacterised protein [Mycobacteroides abscessus]